MSQMPPPSGSRSAVLIGTLVIVLIVVLGGAGFAAWRLVSDDSGDSSAGPATPGSSETVTPAPTPTEPMPATDPKLAKYYDQKLDWKDCGDNQCTSLTVPLDYAAPDDTSIKLAVVKVPAGDRSRRIGSLVVNPGGPGGSGVDYAEGGASVFGKTLTKYFDVVGFDPRGVGRSTPLKCISTSQADDLVSSDPDPDTQAERDHMDKLIHDFGEGCIEHSGDLTKHISTVEAAKDIDILRAALGEPKLDYFGASYGTFLGATYANLFPTHVRRMVLDGAIDPAISNEELTLVQAHGFEVALRAYIADCVSGGDCVLGDSVDEGAKRVRQFLDGLEAKPLPGDGERELTAGTGVLGIWLPLYQKDLWPVLTQALKAAIDDGNGSPLLTLADYYTSRGPNSYKDNSLQALYAVNCLDHDDYIPTSQVPSHFAEFEKASPTFGKSFAFSLSTCSQWPVHTGNRTTALHAPGAPPIVVVGTTRDPATPLVWAQALAKELRSGVLVTRDGDGHTGFNAGNDCVDGAVETYLTKGTPPKDGLAC